MKIQKLKDQARRYEQREEWERALQLYVQLLQSNEVAEIDFPLYNRAGDLHLRLGRPARAVDFYLQAADRYAEIGLYNNAIALCNKALRYFPERPDIYRRLAECSGAQGFAVEARRWVADYAERMLQTQGVDEATRALNEVADRLDDPDIRALLGRRLAGRGKAKAAVRQLKLAYTGWLAAGRIVEAEKLSGEILALDPEAQLEPLPEREAGDADRDGAAEDAVAPAEVDEAPSPGTGTEAAADVALEDEPDTGSEVLDGIAAAGDPSVADDVRPADVLEAGADVDDSADDVEEAVATDDVAADDEHDLDELALAEISAVEGESGPLEGEEVIEDETDELEVEVQSRAVDAAHEFVGDDVANDEVDLEADFDSDPEDDGLPYLEPPADGVDDLDERRTEDAEAPLSDDIEFMVAPEEVEGSPGSSETAGQAPERTAPIGSASARPVGAKDGEPKPADPPLERPEDADLDGIDPYLGIRLHSPDSLEFPDLGELEIDESLASLDIIVPEAGGAQPGTGGADARAGEAPVSGAGNRGEPAAEAEPSDGPLLEFGEEDLVWDPVAATASLTDVEDVLERTDQLIASGNAVGAARVLERLAGRLMEREHYEEAVRVVERLTALRRDDIPLHHRLVELAARTAELPLLLQAYLGLAGALARAGETEKAQVVYKRVLDLQPDNAEATDALANAAQPASSGNGGRGSAGEDELEFEALLAEFRERVEQQLGTDDWSSRYDLGIAFREMGLLDEAITEFQTALRGGEQQAKIYEQLGQCFMEKGQHSVAAKVLARGAAIAVSEGHVTLGLHYHLGRCYEALGRREEAKEAFARVVRANPRFADAEQRFARL